jgi:hypothetical protein
MDVLGSHVHNDGISVAKSKIDVIVELHPPTSFRELRKDLHIFTRLADHRPFAAKLLSAPLHTLLHSGRCEWAATHENAFRMLKEVVGGPELLYSLDLKDGASLIRIVLCPSLACVVGWICQGQIITNSRPAVCHSRVLGYSTQRNQTTQFVSKSS